MPGSSKVKTLDLSRLSDEEAKHVWKVVQRDFDLRKKEEVRLGELKTKVEREDIKRELLGQPSGRAASYCIHCLQPFKFLLNSKRRCLDCELFICKGCSRYDKTEQGHVCNSCHMVRVLRTGTLEWYYENLRARFRHVGSVKVMQSLFKRLRTEWGESGAGGHEEQEEPEEPSLRAESQLHPEKVKRRLTVDPVDFEVCWDNAESRGPSYQEPDLHDSMVTVSAARRKSLLAQAHLATVFQHISEENPTEELVHSVVPSSSMSHLSYSSYGSGSSGPQRGGVSIYLPGCDGPDGEQAEEEEEKEQREEEEEVESSQPCFLFHSHLRRSSHTSQESLTSANLPPQAADLERRISTLETFLTRLELRVLSTCDQASTSPNSSSPVPQWGEVDFEEQQLKQKLQQMTNDISDHSVSSDDDEDEAQRPQSSWRSLEVESKLSRNSSRPTSRTSIKELGAVEEQRQLSHHQKINHMTDSLDRKTQTGPEEEAQPGFRGSTALLVELEDWVAQAAAHVQNSQSEVSDIQRRIAALNAPGGSVERRRKSTIPVQQRRRLSNITNPNLDPDFLRRRTSLF